MAGALPFSVTYAHGKDPGSVALAYARIGDAAQRAGTARLSWVAETPYAFGIETGRHRRGRLARRAGGAYMVRRGGEEALRGVDREVGQHVRNGSRLGIEQTYLGRGRRGVTLIQARTPRVSGQLAGSVQMRLEYGR